MKRRGLTPDGQTLEGLVSGAEKSREEFDKAEAGKVTVSYFAMGGGGGASRAHQAFAGRYVGCNPNGRTCVHVLHQPRSH